jgi:5-methylcytosine-specific restriction endonuclease McrA
MHDCAHEQTRIVWSRINGYGEPMCVRQLRRQCQSRGELFGASLRHELAAPDTPEVDTELLRRSIRTREEAREERWREFRRQREEEEVKWWERYHTHLRSEAWREKRQRVLLRAGCICEGCGARQASDIHHLTYKHMGDEFLFEVVAICRECHERYHGRQF